MKILTISDTHGKHNQLGDLKEYSDCEMIIHAGDVTPMGKEYQVNDFLKWFSKLHFKYKIFIAGNHDFYFDFNTDQMIAHQFPILQVNPEVLSENHVVYLKNSLIEIEGIRIWGSPITPTFLRWAFMKNRGYDIKRVWVTIPPKTDIIVTHGPPMGILDECPAFRAEGTVHVGCEELAAAIKRVKPKYHVLGHIHEGADQVTIDEITYVNASVLDGDYKLVNKPIVIEI